MAVYEVLRNYVIRPTAKGFVRNGLYLKGKAKITQILEGDWWHTDLVLFSRDFDYWSILIRLIKVFNAEDLRNLALGIDGQRNR